MHAVFSPRARRGFTLVELMVVVAITGILAAIGVHLFSSRVSSSKGTEAISVVQALRAAEEAYRAENQAYLDVSTGVASSGSGGAGGGAGSGSGGSSAPPSADWYPNKAPNATRYEWHQCEKQGVSYNADCSRWMALAPSVTRSVYFGFLVNAGPGGSAMTTPKTASNPGLPSSASGPWYVIQGKGDPDGDGTATLYVATSLNGEIYAENE